MDSFHELVSTLLGREGYWVRRDVRVDLNVDDKAAIGRPTNARWEIAIVAYSGRRQELLAVQCKSFLDSAGVRASAFNGTASSERDYYKLFNEENLRRVVLSRLTSQLVEEQFCPDGLTAQLALAAGHIYRGDLAAIQHRFRQENWKLFDPSWLRAKLQELSEERYDDNAVAVTVKLLTRPE
jgi:hypothetical protein